MRYRRYHPAKAHPCLGVGDEIKMSTKAYTEMFFVTLNHSVSGLSVASYEIAHAVSLVIPCRMFVFAIPAFSKVLAICCVCDYRAKQYFLFQATAFLEFITISHHLIPSQPCGSTSCS